MSKKSVNPVHCRQPPWTNLSNGAIGGVMKNIWKKFRIVASAFALVGSGIVVATAAGSSTPAVTYYGCLSSVAGILYNVNTTAAQRCVGRDKAIFWSQVGPTGGTGATGATGAPGAPGTPGATGPT